MLNKLPDAGLDAGASYREMPHNIEAEQAMLGAILVLNQALDRVPDTLTASHFFEPLHGRIFEVLGKMIRAGRQATPVTLKAFFENEAQIDSGLTVPQYLGRLAANATSIINVRDYADTVYDLAVRRQLVILGEDIQTSAYDAAIDYPAPALIEEAEAALAALAITGDADEAKRFGSVLVSVLDRAASAYEKPGELVGLSTGLKDLDAKLGGLANSNLIILAGRPSMGKTALVTNIAQHVAKTGDFNGDGVVIPTPVLFYSMEMSDDELGLRIISSETEISSERIRRGTVAEDDFRRIIAASQRLSELPLIIDDRGGVTIEQLRARARREVRRSKAKLIIVDYLQLMAGSRRGGNTVDDLTYITTGLKSMAKELDVPVIALSQLSRGPEQREDKRPQLADLRGSGSIEQDADVVLFCFREEYYVEREKPPEHMMDKFGEWQARMLACHGKAEVIIAKQRHGPCGTVNVSFQSEFTRFGNLAREYQVPERHL